MWMKAQRQQLLNNLNTPARMTLMNNFIIALLLTTLYLPVLNTSIVVDSLARAYIVANWIFRFLFILSIIYSI